MDRTRIIVFSTAVSGVVIACIANWLFVHSPWITAAASGLLAIAVAYAILHFTGTIRDKAVDKEYDPLPGKLVKSYEHLDMGWFWQTDQGGNLTYLSEKVAERLETPLPELLGKPIVDLVGGYSSRETHEERTLGFHLASHTAFSDLHIRVKSQDDRWWSISGVPQIDPNGDFTGFCGSGSDLTEFKKSRDAVTQLARYDTLTKLANRASMAEALQRALRTRNGEAPKCSVMLLDLDKFKQVNDTMGHPVGDALLKEVAERLNHVIGTAGKVGRLGGDEFEILFPNLTDTDQLSTIANEIIAEIARPFSLSGAQIRIGVSIGVMVVEDPSIDASTVIRNADLALYDAKDAGRGVARFYNNELLAKAADRRELEEELREALRKNELSLVFQPVVEVATESISGFEVLTRWRHPVKGMISPTKFIAVAEDTGLIEAIGDWTLREACAQLAKWGGDLKIAVNVSPIQFRSGNLPAVIMNALASTGVHPNQLELEVTESVFLEGDEENVVMFNRLKKIGVRLALDDFGTGYSALGYLQKAPFDKIKIDQSFVRGATQENSINSAIISSIVMLANDLGMDTTAEGAETHDELDLVRNLGCSHVQGYIYSKPVSVDDATALLEKDGRLIPADGFKTSRESRKSIMQNVGLHHEGYCYAGKIKNLSSRGALIEGINDVPVDTKFRVEFGKGYYVLAVTRWSNGSLMGVQFEEQINAQRIREARGSNFEKGWSVQREAS